jgi:hypothetical protein
MNVIVKCLNPDHLRVLHNNQVTACKCGNVYSTTFFEGNPNILPYVWVGFHIMIIASHILLSKEEHIRRD